MPKLNVTIKWSGKKFENLELGKSQRYMEVNPYQLFYQIPMSLLNSSRPKSIHKPEYLLNVKRSWSKVAF